MKKILILANKDVGLYKFRKELIAELLMQGNSIFISLPKGKFVQPLIDMGCTFINTDVDRRGINPITDLKLLIFYFKLITLVKPDIVITYTIKPNIYGGIVSGIKKVKYAINITGLGTAFQKQGFLKKTIVFLYKIACKKAKVIFFENEDNKKIFIENQIVSEEKTCKLNGAGVNLEEYNFCQYPVEREKIRFLFVGRIMKEKGVEELFEVAQQIKRENNNIIFDIVGSIEDQYEERIKILELQNIIIYHGFQENVKPFIKKSHCFVLPSYHEGMANTLLECGAMGRPLITSNIHGCLEAVEVGVNGYLVNVKDADDLYKKIKQFIELPYEKKVEMGRNSRELIEKKFEKKQVVEKTVEKLHG
ncbi:glycosyltransferase family 4 protein [Bacillus sp. 7884-1]|uniref:glycosyltransferase family 4 protein n=1 Tax=Bacillus sp. 7884-1 TaxID=2021693 RepID=UPI000BA7DA9D|nr:glycosyltransferase family 4 protein [Bacillus sp. 7884-1]PAE38164.1 glycosyltransferase family 1 protein [Bacillus sp. 7884-1]